jgi:hypothetical protein
VAVLSSNPSTLVAAGTWTSGASAYLSDNVYATNVGTTQNTEYPLEVGGFAFSGIPAGSTINSVTVTVEAKTATAAAYESAPSCWTAPRCSAARWP